MSTEGAVLLPMGAATLRRSLLIQARVLRALLLRELITRFGRRNLGVLWLVAEPMLFTVGVAAFWIAAGFSRGSNLPIVAFAVTGYSSVLLWRNMTGHCVHAIQQNFNLLFHRNVRPLDVFVVRVALEAVGATASFSVLTLTFVLADRMRLPVDSLRVLLGWLMLAWFGAALALAIGAASVFSDLVVRFWTPVSYLLFPLSGAAFMVSALPQGLQQIVLWFPMVHGLELLRDGYFGHIVATRYDLQYMAGFCLVLTLFGLLLLRIASRRVDVE